jgi:hypothetical protein
MGENPGSARSMVGRVTGFLTINYTCGLALRIFNFIDYAVRMSLKPYVPGAKTSALRIFHFCTYI